MAKETTVTLTVNSTPQWLALNAYRITLEAIINEFKRDPYFTGQEAAEFARVTLCQFPGGFSK